MPDGLDDIIVMILGAVVCAVVFRWTFGRNPFDLPRYCIGLVVGVLALAGVSRAQFTSGLPDSSSVHVGWDPYSILGQGGGPNVSVDAHVAAGGDVLSPAFVWVAAGTVQFSGVWQGDPQITVQLVAFGGYWQGAFAIVEVANGVGGFAYGTGPTGASKRVVVRVYDSANDRHVEMDIDATTYTVHGERGDSGASTVFDLEHPTTELTNSAGYPPTGLHDGKWYSHLLCQFQDDADTLCTDVQGVLVMIASGNDTKPATTQATSQPAETDGNNTLTTLFGDTRTAAADYDTRAFSYGNKGTSSMDGPKSSDGPMRSHITAFIAADDVLHRNQTTDAAASLNSLVASIDAHAFPNAGSGDQMFGLFGINDGMSSLVGYAFEGLACMNNNTSLAGVFSKLAAIMAFARVITSGLIVVLTLYATMKITLWGFSVRNPEMGTPPASGGE